MRSADWLAWLRLRAGWRAKAYTRPSRPETNTKPSPTAGEPGKPKAPFSAAFASKRHSTRPLARSSAITPARWPAGYPAWLDVPTYTAARVTAGCPHAQPKTSACQRGRPLAASKAKAAAASEEPTYKTPSLTTADDSIQENQT